MTAKGMIQSTGKHGRHVGYVEWNETQQQTITANTINMHTDAHGPKDGCVFAILTFYFKQGDVIMKKHLSKKIGTQLNQTILFAVVFGLSFFTFSLSFAASVPHLINYQGMLTDAQGDPLETNEYKLSFSIFSQATGGTAVWGPQVFNGVPVVKGHFNIILGPLDTSNRDIVNAFVTENAYLEIALGDSAPIAPRQQILSAPYAVQAARAAISTHHSNIIPVGTIVAFWGTTVPPGWRLCDGTIYYGTYRTPDLRGVFLRGLDNGRNLDPGREFGTYQADEFKSHNHSNGNYKYLLRPHQDGHADTAPGSDGGPDFEPDILHKGHILAAGGSETRPKNVAVNFIMYVGY